MPEVKDRQYLITMYKKAQKQGFDIEQYNILRRQLAEVEHDLRRLRDPLYFRYANASTVGPSTIVDKECQGSVPNQLPVGAFTKPSQKSRIAAIIDEAAKKLQK